MGGIIEGDIDEIWDIIDKELSYKTKKLFAKKMFELFEHINCSFLIYTTHFYDFLIENDYRFLKKEMKEQKENNPDYTKEQLFEDYKYYANEERVRNIVEKLYK